MTTGWAGSGDTKQQLKLSFSSQDAAVAYAERNGVPFRIEEPKESRRRQMSYAENFRYDRKIPWTH